MQHLNPELLRRYHAGKCTPEERKQVEDWLAAEDNIYTAEDIVFTDKRLRQEIWQRIEPAVRKNTGMRKKPALHLVVKLAAAACVAALICMGIWYLSVSENNTGHEQPVVALDTYTVPRGSRAKITLADSTVLYALGGTTVQFPKEFIGGTRELTLQEGEIYLQVTHLPDRPFILHTSGTKVKVLGTRFNIRNRKRDSVITVALTEGSIRFISGSHRSEILNPGDVLSYNKIENRVAGVSHSGDADKEAAWARGVLYFDGTPLCEVLERLSDYYGVQFIPAHGIDTRIPFTATIDNMPLQSVLSLMAFATHLQFSHSEKTIFINNQK